MTVVIPDVDIDVFTQDFVREWNGRNLNVNGANVNFDGRYGTQCMDLWNYWWTELGISSVGFPRHADAAGVWEDFNGLHYEYFDGILPSEPAKTGDVFIYNRWAWHPEGGGPGHIGIVLRDNMDGTIQVLETNGLGDGYEDEYMNQYGSPPRIHTWSKVNLYGYLRLIEGNDFLSALTPKEQRQLLADVAEIKKTVAPVNLGSAIKPVWISFRDYLVRGVKASERAAAILEPPKK